MIDYKHHEMLLVHSSITKSNQKEEGMKRKRIVCDTMQKKYTSFQAELNERAAGFNLIGN